MFMRPPFPRPAEPPIKPQYIVLFKGDDSDFEGNQSVDIVIDTELDTTGMKAHFRFMDFVQDFNSIPENKTLSLVFPNAKTSEFPLGAADATLKFEDASGKFRTVSNRIHIVVTNSVHEAYDNEDSQSITVTVKGTVTWDMIEGKPPIPDPVTIDPSLSPTSENPVQNKAVAAALAAKLDGAAAYPAWSGESHYLIGDKVWYSGRPWISNVEIYPTDPPDVPGESSAWDIYEGTIYGQIGGKQDALSSAQMEAVNSGATAAKVATWDGYAAQIAQKANASDVATALAQKASFADLPYALVTPGEWEFSGSGYDPTKTYDVIESGGEEYYSYDLVENGTIIESLIDYSTEQVLSVEFLVATDVFVTATRASLPGHLLDRANNLIDASTGNVTLTLPAYQEGKVRDLLVFVDLGDDGTDPYSITFNFPSGESNTGFEAEGDDPTSATFPAPSAAGGWWYSLTERAPHVFAVSLKQLQSVAAPQAQGGS